MNDALGDRMKQYEMMEAGRILLPRLPIMLRLDGRAFHTFTRGFQRPFESAFSKMMIETMKAAVEFTNAKIGYTQSDEISLILHQDKPESEMFFGGRIQKLTSVIASYVSVFFNKEFKKSELAFGNTDAMPVFDCRVWNVPSKTEAANVLVWREQDATKNSLQMAAQALFSHSDLQNKNGSELHQMMFEKGVNWDAYPTFFKRGTYAKRKTFQTIMTPQEIEKLPPMHEARKNALLQVTRSKVVELDMPIFSSVANREGVIFDDEEPVRYEVPT